MKIGSVVVVHTWRRERIVGLCIAIRRKGKSSTFVIRTHAGIDYTFPIYSPIVAGIEMKKKRMKNLAYKAKLYRSNY